MLAITVANLSAGALAHRSGLRVVIVAGALLAGLGCVGLFGVDAATSYRVMVAQLCAPGLVIGALAPHTHPRCVTATASSRTGAAW